MAQDKENFLARWSRLKQEHEKPPAPKTDDSPAPPLPALDELTHESDFSGFMHPKVGDVLRCAALKKLFSDPHFNLPDPYEAYSGDWTGGEPIPQEMLAGLNQARTLLFDDSKTKEDQPVAEEAPVEPTSKEDEPGSKDA
jgi:uncharacterized protein DUF3306